MPQNRNFSKRQSLGEIPVVLCGIKAASNLTGAGREFYMFLSSWRTTAWNALQHIRLLDVPSQNQGILPISGGD